MIKPGPPGLGCCYPPHPVTVSVHTVHVGTKVPRTHLSGEYSNTGRLPLLEPLNTERWRREGPGSQPNASGRAALSAPCSSKALVLKGTVHTQLPVTLAEACFFPH